MLGTRPSITVPLVHSEHYIGVEQLSASGFYGLRPKVVSYNPRGVIKCFAPFYVRDLTVCYTLKIFGVHFLWLLYALTITFVFGLRVINGYPDTQPGQPSCPAGVNVRLCGLEGTMGLAKEEFRFLIAFLLAGFVADTVQKWGRRRTNYASLCGCTRNLLIQIASLVPLGNADDADGMPGGIATRRTLGRHVILAFELAVLKSRGHLDSEEGKIFLIAEGLVTEAEWEALIPGDRHTAVFFWIQLALRRLTDDGKLSHDAFSQCCACAITDMRAQANDLMSSLDRDTPFP